MKFTTAKQVAFRLKCGKSNQEKLLCDVLNALNDIRLLTDKEENVLDITEEERKPEKVNLRNKFKK